MRKESEMPNCWIAAWGLLCSLVLVVWAGGGVRIEVERIMGGKELLSSPQSLAVSREGSLWVTDGEEPRIHLFSPEGDHVRSFGGTGQGACEFTDRTTICDPGGLFVYVADIDGSRVLKITRSGLGVREIRRAPEDEEGELWRPSALVAAQSGPLYVADAGAGVIETIDTFDALRPFLMADEYGAGNAVQPTDLACKGSLLYICDSSSGSIIHVDRVGTVFTVDTWDIVPFRLDVGPGEMLAIIDEKEADVVILNATGGGMTRVKEHLSESVFSGASDICFWEPMESSREDEGVLLFLADPRNCHIVCLRIMGECP